MFVDIAKIKIKAGNGGDGAVAFHREKYVASGGRTAVTAGAAAISYFRWMTAFRRLRIFAINANIKRRTVKTDAVRGATAKKAQI